MDGELLSIFVDDDEEYPRPCWNIAIRDSFDNYKIYRYICKEEISNNVRRFVYVFNE